MNVKELRNWVVSNAEGLMPETPLTEEEIDHIAMCMHHIYLWYAEDYPLGHVLTAVVRNNFSEASFKADAINRKALYLYALFLANKFGSDYRDKAKAETKVA